MSFAWKVTSLTIRAKLGALSDAKIKMVQEKIGHLFPASNLDDTKNLLIMFNRDEYRALFVRSDEFTFSFGPGDSENNVEIVDKIIESVLDAFLVDNYQKIVVRMVGHLKATTGNAFDETLCLKRMNEDDPLWESLQGIGLRFIYEYHGEVSEIKVEPLLDDKQYYYVENIVDITKLKYSDLKGVILAIGSEAEERAKQIITKYFS